MRIIEIKPVRCFGVLLGLFVGMVEWFCFSLFVQVFVVGFFWGEEGCLFL